MSQLNYINKSWYPPDEQSGARDLGGELYSPLLFPINDIATFVSDREFIQILSALTVGANIIYPDELHKLQSIWLSALQENDEEYVSDGTYYPAHSAMVEWLPVSPFRKDLDQTPDPLILPAWNVYEFELPDIIENILSFFDTSLEAITGYRVGDAYSLVFNAAMSEITDVVSDFLFNGDGENLIDVGFNLHVRGSGTLAVELLSVPLGGRVMYQVDSEPNPTDFLQGFFDENDDILDTERDLISVPPEQDAESIEEITIETDGDHIIYFRLLPTLNDTLIPLSWGAGLRSIRLGDGLTALSAETGEPLTDGESNQNLGLITMTAQDIKDGVIAAWETVSGRVLAGQAGNLIAGIELDKETGLATIKDGTSIGGSKPDVTATSDELLFGGAMGVGRGFRDLVGDIILRKITQARTAQNVADLLRGFYFLRGLVDSVDLLASAFGTPLDNATDVVTPVVSASEVAKLVYCNGANKQSLYRYALAIEDANGSDAVDIAAWYRLLIDEIEDDQILQWYNTGLLSPDTNFASAPCYLIPAFTLKLTADMAVAGSQKTEDNTNLIQKTDNRWRVELSGLMTATNGDTWDGIHLYDASADTYVRLISRMNFGGGAGTDFPAIGQSDDGYSFTFEVLGTKSMNWVELMLNQTNIGQFRVTGVTGELSAKIIDLGGI